MLHRHEVHSNPIGKNLRVVSQKEFRERDVQRIDLIVDDGWQ